ncbi:hypothetical protein H0E87_013867 [Populus deltoides]|uniref:Uncharacterized protein n=1 Tax=Populus deltoides TaxID=3696 RepID=A0A8T2YB95_POPDE|nr:hypothetical protein H0E87_013867 [Populus deltoides]
MICFPLGPEEPPHASLSAINTVYTQTSNAHLLQGKIKIGGMKMKIMESLSQLLHLITSQLPSKLPASPPNIDDLESQSSKPQPSSSTTTSESQSPQARHPPSPQSPTGVRELLPLTINESQRNNIVDAKPDLETELRKTLLNLCFTAALQITIQYGQFIGKKIPTASKVLEKVAFFLAATTFFFAIATPFPLGIKCAIWAVYIMSLIAIAICNCL